jgi:serine/threonine protein kinase
VNTIRICPNCSAALPPDAPSGLCPACRLKTDPPTKPAAKGPLGEPTSTLKLGPEAFVRAHRFGDYELQEEIARGGMGVVWKARQATLNRTVALKMILAGNLAGEAEVQRFRREAEAAANLQHPNIVAIHEVGQHDGQHFYSMDYVEGRDLSALVREGGPLPPARAADCVQTIAEAVHFAHQRGTLHRDLKPQNVLMDAAGVPRITDFGLAKFVERDDSLTQTGAAMGSPSYMPPEQAAGHFDQVGPHSDVYSLGAILYELLTGRPPFRAETAMATMRQVMESDPVAPRKINPAVPPDLETICLKCLEKNPARRYHSARALAEELGRFLKHEPIQAIPVSSVRKAESWLRRNPWTLMAAGSFLVMVLAGLLYWQYERAQFLENKSSLADQGLHPGSRWQQLRSWDDARALVSVIVCGLALYRRYAEGNLGRRQLFIRQTEWEPSRPISQSARVLCGLLSFASLVFTVLFFAEVIHVSVWDDKPHVPLLIWAYAFLTMTVSLLFWVVRDYLKFVHGTPSRTLSAAQTESLRQAILDGELEGAIKLYRRTIADASSDEARDFVGNLAAELKAKHPEKFEAPKPFDLHWQAMGLCLLVESIVFVGLWWMWLTPASLAARLLASAIGFLLGSGAIFSRRLKGFWMRRLVLMFCISVAVLAPTWSSQAGASWEPFGFVLGAFMITSGFTRKRRKDKPTEEPKAGISPAH